MTKAPREPRNSPPQVVANAQRPKHEQLRSILVDDVRAGRLKPGDMLPTEQQLSESFDIARSTVRQALATLERDGLIERIQGKGTFVHRDARIGRPPSLDVFALVLPEIQSAFYPSLQRSFDEAAGRVHNQILVCHSNNNIDRQGNIILQLIDKEVEGVALVPVTAPSTPVYQVRRLQKAGIPVVLCHRGVEGIRAPVLAIPLREVGRLAGRSLVDRGHRRVAFFASHRSTATSGYLDGLLDVLPKEDHPPEDNVYYGSEHTADPEVAESRMLEALSACLGKPDPPTAIYATFDSAAEMIYLLLMRMGLRVPEDISLIGFGGRNRSSPTLRRITSVTVDEAEIGQRAVEFLDRMRREELPIDHQETVVMPIALSDGETLGLAPGRVS